MGQPIDQQETNIETVPAEPNGSASPPNLEFNAVKRFFDMGLWVSTDEANRVSDIVSYLKANNVSAKDISYELRKLERKLGGPDIGETRLGKIWRFFRLLDRSDIDRSARKEIKLYAKHIR